MKFSKMTTARMRRELEDSFLGYEILETSRVFQS